MSRKIKALMILKGVKSIDIARKLGVSHVTVSVVLTGKGKSRRIQQAIADALGVSFHDIWSKKNNKKNNTKKGKR